VNRTSEFVGDFDVGGSCECERRDLVGERTAVVVRRLQSERPAIVGALPAVVVEADGCPDRADGMSEGMGDLGRVEAVGSKPKYLVEVNAVDLFAGRGRCDGDVLDGGARFADHGGEVGGG